MNKFTLIFLLFILTSVAIASNIEDGLYLQAEDTSAPLVKTQEGQKLHLGAKQTLNILNSEVISQNNSNTRFRLLLTIPYVEDFGYSTYILVIAGTAYKITGMASKGQVVKKKRSTYTPTFYISGDENAKQVSEYFGAPLFYRRHPRHNLCVSFTPIKQKFTKGEKVTVMLQITNVGTNSIYIRNRYYGYRDNQYVFSAYYHGNPVQDIGRTSINRGGINSITLKPEEVFEEEINLSKRFSFEKVGWYVVYGSYSLNFIDPSEDVGRTIWEDYASAAFTVRIEK